MDKDWRSPGRLKTHNNQKYLRYFWEVNDLRKWQSICDGGDFRRWYGNLEEKVDFSDAAKSFYLGKGGYSASYSTRKGITWSEITSSKTSFRIRPEGAFNSTTSPTIISTAADARPNAVIAFLNSRVSAYLIEAINPTLHTTIHDVLRLPYSVPPLSVERLVGDNLTFSKQDWDSFETSEGYAKHVMISHIAEHPLSYPLKIGHYKGYVPKKCQEFRNYFRRVDITW
ncbi:hypothetical protein [Lacticaseibacillus mingshuiensis]|uniref:hypothetical protein n=1 Tax=Lacticaseibacillus mingshuiensis TaxID=2799574 RepID=UPI00195228CA|nr:hypothetical protein [Lacticaseibacillus mingshuiensis]